MRGRDLRDVTGIGDSGYALLRQYFSYPLALYEVFNWDYQKKVEAFSDHMHKEYNLRVYDATRTGNAFLEWSQKRSYQ